jgi:hypothetical protein
MIFSLAFKTPGALDDLLYRYQDTHCEQHEEHNQDCNACGALEEEACHSIQEIKACAAKFVEFGEYITIRFDTETGTATVVPLRHS